MTVPGKMSAGLKTTGTGVILSNGLPCSKAGRVQRTGLYRKNDDPLPAELQTGRRIPEGECKWQERIHMMRAA